MYFIPGLLGFLIFEVSSVSFNNPDPSKIHIAADAIRKGNLGVFPTETVYGIGADATNASACKKILKAKVQIWNLYMIEG